MNRRLWSHLRDHGSHFLSNSKSYRGTGPTVGSLSPFSPISRRAFVYARPRLPCNSLQSSPTPRSSAPSDLLDIGRSERAASSLALPATTNVRKPLFSASIQPGRSIIPLTRQTWRREIHSRSRRRKGVITKRNKSSTTNGQTGQKSPQNGNQPPKSPPSTNKPEPPNKDPVPPPSHHYIHLPHLPRMPHRPTKEELLAAATGFWSRLKVRFKWFSIRSVRPWNVDDWSAFVSWFVVGNIVWVLVGTTTFFSLVIFSINTVFAQGMWFPLCAVIFN